MSTNRKILVVDDDTDLTDAFSFYIQSKINCQVDCAHTGNQAIAKLDQEKYDLVISDHNMPDGSGGDLYLALRKKALTPFILHSTIFVKDYPEYKDQSHFYHENKPCNIHKMLELIQKIFSTSEALTPSSEFIPISLDLIYHAQITSERYVQIGENNFVKYIHQDIVLNQEEKQKLEAKKLGHLYIHKADSFKTIQKIELFLSQKPMDDKHILTLQSKSLEFLMEAKDKLGFTSEIQELTEKNINQVLNVCSSNKSVSQFLQNWNFKKENPFSSRVLLIGLISTGLGRKLGWIHNGDAIQFSYAAVLHDITLTMADIYILPTLNKDMGNEKFKSSPEGQAYESHPFKAAELTKLFSGCPPTVYDIIHHHHEKIDGTGFPQKLNHSQLSQLSSLFIIAEDLTEYILSRYEKTTLAEWIKERSSYYTKGHFQTIFDSITKDL